MGKKVWSPSIALLGSFITLAVIYYTYPSLEFNHNIAQFPIWAGLYLVFYQALTHNRLKDWLLLGGLEMLTKYSVIFLLLPNGVILSIAETMATIKATTAADSCFCDAGCICHAFILVSDA